MLTRMMRRTATAAVCGAVILTGMSSPAFAVAGDPGTPDTTFNANVGTSLGTSGMGNYYVYSVAGQSDGKVVVGGYFKVSDGAVSNYVARFLSLIHI